MARGNRREPRCSNSWRPSDGPLPPQSGQSSSRWSSVPLKPSDWFSIAQLSPLASRRYSDIDQRLTPAATQGIPRLPIHTFKNPNLIPIVPRRSQNTQSPLLTDEFGQYKEVEEEQLPQIWHTAINDLIRRTAHDYDLVMNYERDAEGGQRWLPGDIARIRDVGKTLHRDIFALRRWQRVVAQPGDQDRTMMMHIKREAHFVKLLCERVQDAITKYEQKCNLELLRDGVCAQDEDGNLYKATTPEDFVAEGGFLHNKLQPTNEGVEDGGWSHPQDYYQDQYPDYGGAAIFGPSSDTVPASLSQRNLAFEVAFRSTPFDRLKRETTPQTSRQLSEQPITLHPGGSVDSQTSKTHPSSDGSK